MLLRRSACSSEDSIKPVRLESVYGSGDPCTMAVLVSSAYSNASISEVPQVDRYLRLFIDLVRTFTRACNSRFLSLPLFLCCVFVLHIPQCRVAKRTCVLLTSLPLLFFYLSLNQSKCTSVLRYVAAAAGDRTRDLGLSSGTP